MPQRATFLVPWLSATALLTAPALGVLMALAVFDWLAWLHAFAAAATVAVMGALIVRRHVRDLTDIVGYVDRLVEQQQAPVPHLSGMPLTEAVLAAVRRLDKAWRARTEQLTAGIAINESLLDSLPDPIILLDAQRRVLFSNAAARQSLGTGATGRDLASLVREPRVLESVSAVLNEKTRRETTFDLMVPTERHFAVRIEPLREETAGGGVCVLAMTDLTEMKRVDDMRSDFIANASHELRTPLSSLIGFIETLRGPARDDPPAREQFLDLMHQQAQRMARLVRDLLSLSQIEMTEHRAPSGEVDVSGLLRGVIDALRPQAQRRSVSVDLVIEDGLPPVTGESDQLTQLFQNLVDNAIKYGAADGRVTITARPTAPEPGASATVAVSVADQGEGIPKDHIPRLTERFYRVDPARSRAVGGTGLGLAIVKHIVNRHRGQLRIESEPGRGSVFTVHLPVAGQTP